MASTPYTICAPLARKKLSFQLIHLHAGHGGVVHVVVAWSSSSTDQTLLGSDS